MDTVARHDLSRRVEQRGATVGVTVRPIPFAKRALDVALSGFESTPNPTGNSAFGCGGSQNFTGYCQRLVTKDLDQADRILDARQQARVMNRADAQMARDMPALPLFQVPVPTAVRNIVKNFVQALNPLTNSENWWRER